MGDLRTTAASLPALTGAGLADVLAERVGQIDVEGFTLAHDLGHHPGELALAANSYLNTAVDQLHGRHHPPTESPDTWPWQREAWRPGDARANLVKAGAILLAVLDRLDMSGRVVGWPGANHSEQVAYDAGHGRRDISHHPDNRYGDPKLRAAYDRGFADRDAQLSQGNAA